MPKPAQRVSEVRPKQAVFAASIRQFPIDDVHWADEIHPSGTGFRRLAQDFWRPILARQFPGRGFN